MRSYPAVAGFRPWRYRSWLLAVGAVVLLAGILTGTGTEARAVPISIAVFGFELDDFSAGAGIAGNPAQDRAELRKATDEARRLIAGSGRYVLTDMSGTDKAARSLNARDGRAARDRNLQYCGGCEASVARALGADESFLGIVSRISRTEYVVRFQIRAARTGRLVLAAHSDLLLGPVTSWHRGVAVLLRDRLLQGQDGGTQASWQAGR